VIAWLAEREDRRRTPNVPLCPFPLRLRRRGIRALIGTGVASNENDAHDEPKSYPLGHRPRPSCRDGVPTLTTRPRRRASFSGFSRGSKRAPRLDADRTHANLACASLRSVRWNHPLLYAAGLLPSAGKVDEKAARLRTLPTRGDAMPFRTAK